MTEVIDHYIAAAPRQRQCNPSPNPAAAAGNDGAFPLQLLQNASYISTLGFFITVVVDKLPGDTSSP
ncbi:hypothetical protein CLDAP_22800 [Caldilinea aerophila DSM 14535 = NBRC 104270]|uniref:Uncharacterized protein n=1 Tax=Caldilinea aerophila (strain DSM 14535 / JCM 11387 / NBRC 104270 / STL-6-O1) TaxID=926550 RepID=I0I4Y2_CALAS|nr:hypothetical protein CLDAP_22800 [Caldilinea aerophila DSM 14535 = NBRC 104270]